MPRMLLIALSAAFLAICSSSAHAQSSSAWAALKSGQAVGVMRHAKAPGRRPKNRKFDLSDCSTQRNLSNAGRAQARRIGRYLRSKGINGVTVLTSEYCRCAETARLLKIGPVSPSNALNSLPKGAPISTQPRNLLTLISGANGPTILVTHMTNIRAVTGITPASGETLIVSRAGKVLGRIPPK